MPDVLLKRSMFLLAKDPAPAGFDAVVKYITANKAKIGLE